VYTKGTELLTLLMDDNIWKEEFSGTVAVVNADNGDRKKLLEAQLDIGKHRTSKQKAAMINLMIKKHNVFALTDKELEETNLVEHPIDMSDTTAFKPPPRRLPYALRNELESELQH